MLHDVDHPPPPAGAGGRHSCTAASVTLSVMLEASSAGGCEGDDTMDNGEPRAGNDSPVAMPGSSPVAIFKYGVREFPQCHAAAVSFQNLDDRKRGESESKSDDLFFGHEQWREDSLYTYKRPRHS